MYMNKNTLIISVVILLLIGGGYALSRNSASTTQSADQGAALTPKESGGSTATTSNAGTREAVFTSADVAKHADATSCYTSIRGSVYDLTAWIGKHPGGEQAILSICGKDGTSAFEGQHGGQPRPEHELDGFRIGALTQP